MIASFTVAAMDVLAPPREPDFMERLEFEVPASSAAIIGTHTRAANVTGADFLAQHAMPALDLAGTSARLQTAFMWTPEQF